MKIDVVADEACRTGEGPLWHPDERCVYWVDIPAGKMFRYDPGAARHATVYADRPIGGYVLLDDGGFLLFRDRGNIVRWRDGRVVETIIEEVDELRDTRFNDVCADPLGGVFCGTMSSKTVAGRLYRLDNEGRLHLLLEGLGTPNGMGFSPDRTRLYFNDSGTGLTWLFDFDTITGAIDGQRLFRDASASNDPGHPDGLAVDAEGGVWTARWDGSSLLRFAPDDGRLLERIAMPALKVSSLCFAGDNLGDIYATTAGGQDRATNGPQAGALFRVRDAGVVGLDRFRARVGVGS